MYYLRSRPAADPIKFTLDVESLLKDAGNIHILKKKKSEENILKNIDKENLKEEPTKKIKKNDG